MGDSKIPVTKAEIFELARSMGADINNVQARIHGLSVALDCLITVLGKGEEVKAEIQRRIEAAKPNLNGPDNKRNVEPDKPALACECCKTTVNVVEDGLYGVYCNPCLNDISTIGECANTHVPVEQAPLIDVP